MRSNPNMHTASKPEAQSTANLPNDSEDQMLQSVQMALTTSGRADFNGDEVNDPDLLDDDLQSLESHVPATHAIV